MAANQTPFAGVPSQREPVAEKGDGGLVPTRSWFYFWTQTLFNATVATGTVLRFAGASTAIPQGYLLTNGAAVSRKTFSALFSVIGTSFGAGDGSSTFNVPTVATAGGILSMIKT